MEADRRENVGVKLQADHVLAFAVMCPIIRLAGQADLVMELSRRRGTAVMLRSYLRSRENGSDSRTTTGRAVATWLLCCNPLKRVLDAHVTEIAAG